MSKHQGNNFRSHLKINRINIGDFAKKAKISRGQIYLLFDMQEIEQLYKDKITEALGENIFASTFSTDSKIVDKNNNFNNENNITLVEANLVHLQLLVETQRDYIQTLKEQLKECQAKIKVPPQKSVYDKEQQKSG